MDWYVATDLKHNTISVGNMKLTTKHPGIVIWSVKAKIVFIIKLMVPFEENFDWGTLGLW